MSLTDLLVLHSAPTLAGLKSASLLSLQPLTERTAFPRKALEEKGLFIWPLKNISSSTLLLVYRPRSLEEILSSQEAVSILSPLGYDCSSLKSCLARLRERFMTESFPHEVGIFLGYPLGDVRGFIENKGRNFRFSGLWKVYDDEDSAKKLLDKWTKCRAVYWAAYSNGTAIEKLCITA